MSVNLTPDSGYTPADTLTIPVDGELAGFQTGPAPLQPLLQKVFNRLAYAFLALDGHLTWGRTARVATGGTNNASFKVYVPPVQAVVLFDGSNWDVYSSNAETELTSSNSFASGTLANDTTYYVYGKISGGALAFEVSTAAPDTARTWKTSTVGTHRYLFWFHTSSAGVPLPMQMRGGLYLYRYSAITSTELRALNTTSTAGSPVDMILARGGTGGRELLPPHMRAAFVRSELTVVGNHANDKATAYYVSTGDTTGNTVQHDVYAPTTIRNERDFWIECDGDRKIQYSLLFSNSDAGDPTATLNVFVLGGQE